MSAAVLVLVVATGAMAQAAPAPSTLAEARAAIAKASQAELPARLDACLSSLPIPDAIALVDECLPKLAAADKASLLVKTAGLAFLVGSFAEASARYESASTFSPGDRDSGLLLKAGRCALAAGDAEKTTELSALVLAAGADPASTASARLLGAWALAFRGRAADALGIASSVIGQGAASGAPAGNAAAPATGAAPAAAARADQSALPVELRREARFLVWLCSAKDDKAKASAALAAEFPGSPEALIASGAVSTPPLPHWYLGELGALRGRAPAATTTSAGATPTAKSTVAAPTAQPAAQSASGAASPASSAAPAKPAPTAKSAPTAQPTATAPKAQPAPAPAAPTAQPAPGVASSAQSAGAQTGGRLQVGYFSVEANAKRLAAELKSKGFASTVEARPRVAGSSAPEDRRWLVLVDAGADYLKTMASLKDAGYESYGVE